MFIAATKTLFLIVLDEQGYVSHCDHLAEQFFVQHQSLNEMLHGIKVRNDQQIQQAIEKCLQDQAMRNMILETPDGIAVVLTCVPLVK